MKLKLLTLLFGIVTYSLSSQTNIYVSNSGMNTGTSLPTINNPAKTLENAYDYIKNNLSNSSNQATTPINVYLMDNGGEILVSNTVTSNNSTFILRLDWEVSGTSSNPILLTSYSSRATLTRNSDTNDNPILQLIGVNYMTIKAINFNRAIGGGVQINNGDYNQILYCSFHGDGGSEVFSSGGIIWVGVKSANGYLGENTSSSSNNTIAYNLIYDIKVTVENVWHHGIYISNGAHDNSISHNYINFAPCHGILGQHADYKDNYISTNLVSTNYQSTEPNKTGISLSGQFDFVPEPNNGYPNSITNNNAVNNYVYDSDDSDAVSIASNLPFNNIESNNIRYNNLYPADPYWLGYTADKITDRMVTGDFDEDGSVDDVAAFYDLGSQTKIHVWRSKIDQNAFEYSSSNGWWHGTSFTPSKISKRVIVGDFDHDTYKDDIAVFYDYGGFNTKIWVWISNGSSFETPQEWWPSSGFNSNQISGRVVSGDFDEDGWEDDIAAFYDNGNSVTKLHVWRSNGVDEFQHMGSSSQWSGPVYSASAITDRVVSGDFDNDGFKDDIAAFYNNGDNNTILHVWKWSLPNLAGDPDGQFDMFNWWSTGGYSSNNITGRVVSGDFDGNGIDDIGAFYDNTNSNTNIHTWLSSGTHMTYQNSSGWWTENNNGYDVQNITGRVISGDFNNDGKYDISAFYDYSSTLGSIRSNVWHSSGNNSFTNINESLGYPWLTNFSYYPAGGSTSLMARIQPDIQEETQELIQVYPNPTSEQVQFEFRDTPLAIKVFDLSGKLVIDKDISDKNYVLDVSDQTSGIYFYKISFIDGTLEGRLVIK